MPLYHLTSIYNKDYIYNLFKEYEGLYNDDDFKIFLNRIFKVGVDKFSEDLSDGKWFSLNKYHPVYYGYKKNNNVVLNYKTKDKILLLDMRGLERKFSPSFRHCFHDNKNISLCVDGWIMKDDPGDDWYEIFLKRPYEKIDPNYKIIEYTTKQMKNYEKKMEEMKEISREKKIYPYYPYGDVERQLIEEFTTGTGILSIKDGVCDVSL